MIVRPLRHPDDLVDLVDIRNGAVAVAEGGVPAEMWTVESFEHYLGYPAVDPDSDLLVLAGGEGERCLAFALLASSHLSAPRGGRVIELWELWVNPYLDRTRLGTVLLKAVIETARRKGAELLRTSWVHESWNWHGLLDRAGFGRARLFVTMKLAPPSPPADAEMADADIQPFDYRDQTARRTLVRLYNDTFAHNWGVEPQSVETISYQLRTGPEEGAGAGYGFIHSSGEPVGFIMSYLDRGRNGWVIDAVGVAQSARGRGYGRRLVSWVLALAAQADAGEVLISVDSLNEAAIGLYRGLGFEDWTSHDVYECSLQAAPK